MKIVINRYWGGYGISKEAAEFMAARGSEIAKTELEKYRAEGNWYGFMYGVERNDPLLVLAVETLGEESWGELSKLEVVEIPYGISWYIRNDDGMESVEEEHRSWG